MWWIAFVFAASGTGPLKSPEKAVLWSLLPGGGQFYTAQPIKGVVLGGVETFFLIRSVQHGWQAYQALRKYRTSGNPSDREAFVQAQEDWLFNLFWYLSFWGYATADAYISAHLFAPDQRESHLRQTLGVYIVTRF